MTVLEIKSQINKGLEQLTEDALSQILTLVKELQERSDEEIKRDHYFEKIIADNKDVLERLAK